LPRTHDRTGEVRLPWKLVFLHIRDQTRKPVIAGFVPTGSFKCPRGAWMNPAQFVEAVKAALLQHEQPWLLIERERNFILVPADEKIDPT
jgi:hypothetical protein